jgi:HD-GYP domain-containing protein (c-di-GMP phosphodiesterase class II)
VTRLSERPHAPEASREPPVRSDPQDQRRARGVIVALHGALRAVRLYPIENAAVQQALGDLDAALGEVQREVQECELRRTGDFVFVNDTRVRLGLDNYAAIVFLVGLLRAAGIGTVRITGRPGRHDWVVLLAFLQAPPLEYPEAERLGQVEERLQRAGVTAFTLAPPGDVGETGEVLDARERARHTYARSLDVSREMMTAVRLGRSPSLKRVKRAVQGVVDAILTDSASLIGLTTLREFDDYTFVHSVNVCILSVALGRRLGLTKPQLLELGVAALLHDIGKSRVPTSLLNKRGALEPDERVLLQEHTWQGVLALFAMPLDAGRPWRAMTSAFEHHMRVDLSGYPNAVRARRMSLFSRIIAVADGFDAATTARVYQGTRWSPADVLLGMRDNARLGFDPVLVKAFINLTGIYPVGTVVVLDSFELGLVHAANPVETELSRPIVRLLSDAQGNLLADPPLVDLLARDEAGHYLRTIIRTDTPDRWGIRVSDYFS